MAGAVREREGLRSQRPGWIAPIAVWIVASTGMWLAITWVQIFSPDWVFEGFKIREGSSDTAWQTIRLWEMWKLGPEVLWWQHIYPPLYDGIRFLLMQPEVSNGASPDAIAVDSRLYLLQTVLFGLVAMVVYLWVRDLTGSGWWGAAGAALWCLVPGSVAYFVLLNQTGVAVAAMAVAFYLLYRFLRTRVNLYAAGFLTALLVASLTRNVVQIHVFVVIVIAACVFYWIGRPRHWWALAVNLLLVVLIGFWPARAYILYSTFDVSTHTGYNRAGALWLNPLELPMPESYPANLESNALRLSSGWNTQETLKDNWRLGKATDDFIREQPIEAVSRAVQSLQFTLPTMFRSISVQWYNGFNATFPLAGALDWIFSGWRFVTLILLAAAIIIRDAGWRGTLDRLRRYGWFAVFWVLTAIPVFLSNRYWPVEVPEPVHSEADRLRALIDVPVYVLMAFAAFIVARDVRRRISRRRSGELTPPEDVPASD